MLTIKVQCIVFGLHYIIYRVLLCEVQNKMVPFSGSIWFKSQLNHQLSSQGLFPKCLSVSAARPHPFGSLCTHIHFYDFVILDYIAPNVQAKPSRD